MTQVQQFREWTLRLGKDTERAASRENPPRPPFWLVSRLIHEAYVDVDHGVDSRPHADLERAVGVHGIRRSPWLPLTGLLTGEFVFYATLREEIRKEWKRSDHVQESEAADDLPEAAE